MCTSTLFVLQQSSSFRGEDDLTALPCGIQHPTLTGFTHQRSECASSRFSHHLLAVTLPISSDFPACAVARHGMQTLRESLSSKTLLNPTFIVFPTTSLPAPPTHSSLRRRQRQLQRHGEVPFKDAFPVLALAARHQRCDPGAASVADDS
jgi:hypothetical protein